MGTPFGAACARRKVLPPRKRPISTMPRRARRATANKYSPSHGQSWMKLRSSPCAAITAGRHWDLAVALVHGNRAERAAVALEELLIAAHPSCSRSDLGCLHTLSAICIYPDFVP